MNVLFMSVCVFPTLCLPSFRLIHHLCVVLFSKGGREKVVVERREKMVVDGSRMGGTEKKKEHPDNINICLRSSVVVVFVFVVCMCYIPYCVSFSVC